MIHLQLDFVSTGICSVNYIMADQFRIYSFFIWDANIKPCEIDEYVWLIIFTTRKWIWLYAMVSVSGQL